MKTGGCAKLVSAATTMVLIMALPYRPSYAQPGGGGGGGGGGVGEGTTDTTLVPCPSDGSGAHYDEFLSGQGSTTVRWAGSYTGCPNHVNWPLNPNPAAEIPSNASIPAYPMLFENGGTTDLSMAAGHIGIMRNGVGMYSPWAADRVVEYEDTAFYLEADTFDLCGGHATPTGSYHYHGTAGCLQEQAGGVVGQHSPVIGWSYDGFPFYGQLGPGGTEMKMCGADGADPTVCLDSCSGYEAFIDEDEFAYRYYTSCGFDESFFPFTANCYRGCCPEGVTCDGKVEACGTGAEIGFTDELVPVAYESLDDLYDAELISGNDAEVIGSDSSVNCTLYLGAGSISVLASEGSTPSPTAGSSSWEISTTSPTAAPSTRRVSTTSPTTADTAAVVDDNTNASTQSPTSSATSSKSSENRDTWGPGTSPPSPQVSSSPTDSGENLPEAVKAWTTTPTAWTATPTASPTSEGFMKTTFSPSVDGFSGADVEDGSGASSLPVPRVAALFGLAAVTAVVTFLSH